MRKLSLLVAMLAFPALAEQAPRDTDATIPAEELNRLLQGNMLEFHTGGFARYGPKGGYDYRYEMGGPPAPGVYEIRGDSMVCVDFHNGFDRCDMIVRSGERYVMIIENGERYPIKAITALE